MKKIAANHCMLPLIVYNDEAQQKTRYFQAEITC